MSSSSSAPVTVAASPTKEKAVHWLRYLGLANSIPSFTSDSVLEATPTRLKVKLPAREFIASADSGFSQIVLGGVCQMVMKASFMVHDETNMDVDNVFLGTHNFYFRMPELHEDIVIKAMVHEYDGPHHPALQFNADIVRDGVKMRVATGTTRIFVIGDEDSEN